MNPATLMHIRIDFLKNKNILEIDDYKRVIDELVMEVERLNARDISNRIIIDNLRSQK